MQITKGKQRSGNRKGRERGGERWRPRSGLLRDDVGICPQEHTLSTNRQMSQGSGFYEI